MRADPGAAATAITGRIAPAEKARVGVPSSSQGFLFPAPGFGRDVYYQSITTIARVAVS